MNTPLYCPFRNSPGFSTMDRVDVPDHGHRNKGGNTLAFKAEAELSRIRGHWFVRALASRGASRDCGSQYGLRGT